MRSIQILKISFLLIFTFACSAIANTSSTLLEKVRQKNLIIIGVKTNFEPFGFTDSAGIIWGFEIDLAKKIAQEIGVEVGIVGVTTGNRFQRLEQGAVDMVIATAADTRERRKIATAIEPGYFGAGVNVLLRPEVSVESWNDLRSKKLCGLAGAYFNFWDRQ
jgi:polar amino acid transport system substrate-binding protein